MLCIYADYKSDESYTPSKISVRVGNNFHNLQEIRVTVPFFKRMIVCLCYYWRSLLLTCSSVSPLLSAAVGDGGAQWLDSHLSHEPGKIISSDPLSHIICFLYPVKYQIKANKQINLICCWFLANKRADQHLHDPDRSVGQSSERQRHSHASDKSLHSSGGELHRQVPTMHHSRLHDVQNDQVTWDYSETTWASEPLENIWNITTFPEKRKTDRNWTVELLLL